MPRKDFYNTWNKIVAKLDREAIIVINIFGNRDEWYQDTEDMTFMNEVEFRNLIADLNVLHFYESEKLGTCMGKDGLPMDKKWHIFECIVKI